MKRLLLTHEPALRKAAEGVEGPASSSRGSPPPAFPRYARVNPLKTTVAAAVAALVGKGKEGKGVVASEAEVQVSRLLVW